MKKLGILSLNRSFSMYNYAMIPRQRHLHILQGLLTRHPVVAILGARQVGKTTLARELMTAWKGPSTRFDLEDPDDLVRLTEPKLELASLKGLIVIDEVQRRPDLFPVLRVLVDQPQSEVRFLVLGSASPELLKQSSESLAGRIVYHKLEGFALDEVGITNENNLWLRGGFPRSYLAEDDEGSFEWRTSFVQTFLERDIPQLGIQIPSTTLRRFWQMLAHYHAQTWNGAELARAIGVAESTVRRYLDILTGALVIRQLPPWHENIGKRQVKSPKIYVSDSGILHTLLRLRSREELLGHPKVGASWEGFVLQEIISRLGLGEGDLYFWATHSGAELDLLLIRGAQRIGFEIKRSTAPTVTRSMRSAIESLRLDQIEVIHAGEHTFSLADGIRAVSFGRIDKDLETR